MIENNTNLHQPISKQAQYRTMLEKAREDFHELLNGLSDHEFAKQKGSSKWTMGEVMFHVAWCYGDFYLPALENARKGKIGVAVPSFLLQPLNYLITHWLGRGATRQSIAQKYDKAHGQVLAVLNSLREDEWNCKTVLVGNEVTVEAIFHEHVKHVAHHAAQIQLNRK